jgi:hypothetical protein
MSERQCDYELLVVQKNGNISGWGSVWPDGDPSIETAVEDISLHNEGWLDDTIPVVDQRDRLIDEVVEDAIVYVLYAHPYDKPDDYSGPKIVDTLFRL